MNSITTIFDISCNERERILSYLRLPELAMLQLTCRVFAKAVKDSHLAILLLRRDFDTDTHTGTWEEYINLFKQHREKIGIALLTAAKEGDVKMVKQHLKDGARVNHSMNRQTPLIEASINSHLAVARLLLREGADPNRCDSKGNAPLKYAAHKGNHKLVRILLGRGAQASDAEADEQPLHFAADQGHVRVVRLLLEHGADWRLTDTMGRSALYCALHSKASTRHQTVSLLRKYMVQR